MCIFHQLSDEHQQTIREIFNAYSHQALPWIAILDLLKAVTVIGDGLLLDPESDRICVAVNCGQECRIGIFPRWGNRQFADLLTIRDIRNFLETIDVQPDK